MISKFYSIEYEEAGSDKFQTIYDNVTYLFDIINTHIKTLLRESIVDLFRLYDAAKKAIVPTKFFTDFSVKILDPTQSD